MRRRADAFELEEEVRGLLDKLRLRYMPNEADYATHPGRYGFDVGYRQALAEVESGLYQIFVQPDPEAGGSATR